MNLGERIQNLLDEKQITQRELAEQLHITPNAINGYIKNRRSPDCATLVRMAQVLDTSSDYLLGITPYSHPPLTDISPDEIMLLNHYRTLDHSHQILLEEIAVCLCENLKMPE